MTGDPDPDLLREKGGRGFPTLMFLDADGEMASPQTDRSVAGFRKMAAALANLAALERKESRSAEDEVKLFCARVDLGAIDLAQAQKMRGKLPFPPTEMGKIVDERLITLEVKERLKSARGAEATAEAGAHFAKMIRDGRVPKAGGPALARFWLMAIEHAKVEEDAALFEKALAGLKATLASDARYKLVIEQFEQALEELKRGG